MDENLTLHDLIKIFKERLLLILLITFLAILVAAGISFYLLTPVYETSTQILVNQNRDTSSSIDNLNIETDLQLINTYSVIIKSPVILDKVIERMNLPLSAKELNNKIAVDSSEDSQVFNLTVKYEDPQTAVGIANTTAQVFQTEIQTLMDVNNVSILTPAVLDSEEGPVFPNSILNMLMAAVVGLVLGSGIALLLSYLDNTLKNEEDVKKLLDIPVVGTISPIIEKEKTTFVAPVVLKRKEV
ncbi:capsular biosynthesis protein [Planococcus glaciei]|uniref:YveK family protein n=1 Tax=Planococcus glaciei TaxID=459472 RepID=UPI00069EB3D2|nr:Wzz/FepE/Etk N-terminal domain-containing protein [Planococcus glaciei]KOF08650.1 capsular biosynthesis protein [Planococcus glaciei]